MKIVAITPVGKNDSFANFIIDGLNNLNIDVIATDAGNNVKNTYSDDEVIEHSKDADYIFAFSAKHTYNGVPEPRYYLLDKINRPEVTAYLDGSEYNYMYWPYGDKPYHVNKKFTKINEDIYKKCHKYFKIVVYDNQLERKKLVPCMIGTSNHYISTNITVEKEYDLYCSFGGSAGQAGTGLRSQVYDYCLEIKKSLSYLNCIVGEGFNFDGYVDVIRKSYIAISGWGAEQWCRRDFEITSNGTCCFIEKPTMIYPNPFIDGESCVYYSSMNEFRDKLEYYLNNKEKCIEIGKNAKSHTEKYHTPEYRIQYIFDNMKK